MTEIKDILVYRGYRYNLMGTRSTKSSAQKEAENMRNKGMGAVIKAYDKEGRFAIYGSYK